MFFVTLLKWLWHVANMPATIGGQWTIILLGTAGIVRALQEIGKATKAAIKFFERMDERFAWVDRLRDKYPIEEIIRRLEKLENGKH